MLTHDRLPFYAYIRLFLLSYLVLPQTQGAKLLYQQHIHPFLAHHEHEIDRFITSAHDRARSAGLLYIKRAIEFVKENLLGIQPKPRPAVVHQPSSNYAQSLLSRFNLPNARQGLAAPAGDFYGILSAAVGNMGAAGASREAQVDDLSRSGTLIPQDLGSTSEKMTFLSMQRERLRVLLTALDREASDLGTEAAIERDVDTRMAGQQLGEGLKKSKSEAEFEEIDKEGLRGGQQGKPATAGGWMPWNWSPKGGNGAGPAGAGSVEDEE